MGRRWRDPSSKTCRSTTEPERMLVCGWKLLSRARLFATPWIVHGILQARIPEWVSLSLLPGIFQTQGLNPGLPALQADSLSAEPQRKPERMLRCEECSYKRVLRKKVKRRGEQSPAAGWPYLGRCPIPSHWKGATDTTTPSLGRLVWERNEINRWQLSFQMHKAALSWGSG